MSQAVAGQPHPHRSPPRASLSGHTNGAVMALSDRLGSTPQRITGRPCSVGALEDYLTGAEADAFHAMLHTLGWSGARIYKAVQDEAKELREAGELEKAAIYGAMAEQTVNRHRATSCRCYKQSAA